jgi:hypothetical protein
MQDNPLRQNHDTVRIPVYGEEKVHPGILSNYFVQQQFINCYPVINQNPVNGEKSVKVMKRPGAIAPLNGAGSGYTSIFTASGAADASNLHVKVHLGISQLTDVFIVAVWDSVRTKTYIIQWRPVAGTATLLGDIGTTSYQDFVHITEYQQVNSGTLYPAIAISWKKWDESVSRCYTARSDGTVFTTTSVTRITDTGFPDQQTPAKICTGPFQQMNGLIYIMCTDGSIYNSGGANGTPNDASSSSMWNTLSVIQTYQSPDKGLGIYRYKHHLVAFGKDSIEFFNDIGNPPPASSLERTQQAFIKFGALTSLTILNIQDTLYWVAYGSNNICGLWKMDGYAPVKVSRAKQDHEITSSLHTNTAYSSSIDLICLIINGRQHIGINGVASYTMLYGKSPASWGASTDAMTFYQNNYNGAVGFTSFYNSTDDVWWSWNVTNGIATRIVPAVYFSTTSTTTLGHYSQYFFYDPIPGVVFGSQTVVVVQDYGLKLADNDSYDVYTYSFCDPVGAGTTGASFVPIVCNIQFNMFQFDTQKRKRINKINLIFDYTPHQTKVNSWTDTSTNSISLIYRKGNDASLNSQTLERYIPYPNTSGRYYFNNLGMGREWSFSVVSNSLDSFDLKALELDIEQGVN